MEISDIFRAWRVVATLTFATHYAENLDRTKTLGNDRKGDEQPKVLTV
jgi:hypothetical protein